MKTIGFVLVLMLVTAGSAKADPNSQALVGRLQVKAQECYPDNRYVVANGELVPAPKPPPPQRVTVYAPPAPVYVAPPPQVYLGFGYSYWSGHGGHHGNCHGGGHH